MAHVKTDTWYSRYPADYLKDTLLLTLEEDGFFNRALDQIYICRGRIPADPIRLQLLLRLAPDQWARCRWIMDKFFYLDGDTYGNARADEEIAKAQANAENARENGKKGGRPPKNNPGGTQDITQAEPGENPGETHGLTQTEPRGKAKPNPEKSSSSSPPSSSSSLPAPGDNAHARVNGSISTAELDKRAKAVYDAYPDARKGDKGSTGKGLFTLDVLCQKMRANPDYPWMEHAKLYAQVEDFPLNMTNWLQKMPDKLALESLRKAAPVAPARRML